MQPRQPFLHGGDKIPWLLLPPFIAFLFGISTNLRVGHVWHLSFMQTLWKLYTNLVFNLVSNLALIPIIMALVAHYNLKLHQIDVKIIFLNGDLEEKVYMDQPKGFLSKGKKILMCKLKKLIYELKQVFW